MDQVQKFLTKLFRGIGSPLSKRCEALVARGEWGQLQQLSTTHPSNYRYPAVLLRDQITLSITKKLIVPGQDPKLRKEKALAKFFASEADCFATNARIRRLLIADATGFYPEKWLYDVSLILNQWRREVKRVLGRCPNGLRLRYSKGSTLSDTGKQVTIPDKMSSRCSLYPASISVWEHTVKGTLLEFEQRPFVKARSNRLFTVPKNYEEDRLAAVEASGSLALQLACGLEIRRRYNKGYQVDMSALQPRHREMARIGSKTGGYATIDLSSASDTVAIQLVKAVLPWDWYELLNSLRATHTDVFGQTHRLEKFSTMGNGFTFELETLLFRSLCKVVGAIDEMTSVYGDDIVIDTASSGDVIAALRFFGFTPNPKKTFCEGPFRESCGGDFHDGYPVRGHYLKELPDEPQHWIALANGLRRVDPDQRWTRAAWRFCIDQLPSRWRVFGPSSMGDLVIHVAESELSERCVIKDGERWFWAQVPIPVSIRVDRHFRPEIVLAAATFGVPSTVSIREAVVGYRRKLLREPGASWLPPGVETKD